MSRPVRARVDLNLLHSNLQRVRTLAPDCRIMAVIKANAYGHGAVVLAGSIQGLVDGFAVAGIDEAVELSAAGIEQNIFLLYGFHEPADLERVSSRGYIPVVHCREQIDQLQASSLPLSPMTAIFHRCPFHL